MTTVHLDAIQELHYPEDEKSPELNLLRLTQNDVDLDDLDLKLPWLFHSEKLILTSEKPTFCDLCQALHHLCPCSGCKKSFTSFRYLDQHLKKSHALSIQAFRLS